MFLPSAFVFVIAVVPTSTKRRERHQKLNRGKKDTGSPSRFAHMTAMQNGHEPPHR
jgi:hypothetical protein